MNFLFFCNYYFVIFEYSYVIFIMELINVEVYRRNNEDLFFYNFIKFNFVVGFFVFENFINKKY